MPLLESGFTRTGCVDGGGFRGLTFLATRSFINMWQKKERIRVNIRNMYLLPSPFFFGNTKPLRGGEGEPRYVVEKINQEKCYRGKRTGFLFIHDRSLLGCPRYLSQGYELSGIVTCRRTIRASFLSSTERETHRIDIIEKYEYLRFSAIFQTLQ